MQYSRTRALRWLAEIALILIVVAVAAPVFATADARRDGDEALKIGSSGFFQTLFIRHDFSEEAWPDGYETRTHPMIVRYVLGGWLTAHGYDIAAVSGRYDHSRKWTTNVEMGNAPSEPMLREARVPMRALAVVCAVLLYGVVRIAVGPVGGQLGGLAAALLMAGSPYLNLHLVRAKGDVVLLTFLLASLMTGVLAIKRSSARGPSLCWGVLTGLLLGLALGSKLTAILALVAVMVWGAWATWMTLGGIRMVPGLRGLARFGWLSPPAESSGDTVEPSVPGPPPRRGWLLWAPMVVLVAYLVFVVSNPYLYRDPLGRTVIMLQDRAQEMAREASVDPERAVTTLQQRIKLVWYWSLMEDTWGDSQLRWSIEMPLALAGLGILLVRFLLRGRAEDAWLLLWVVGIYGGVTWGLGYLLDHYFVPTATMTLLLSGLAIGWGAGWLWRAALKMVSRTRHTSTAAAPSGSAAA